MTHSVYKKILTALVLTASTTSSHAEMIEALTGFNINETPLLKDNGVVIGGWATAGVTYNATNPKDNFNGTVGFADRANEFQLNQLNVFIEKAVATEGDDWDFGGRFDVMFGTDAIFTQAFGATPYDINTANPAKTGSWDFLLLGDKGNRFYDLAFPQAYVEAYAPIGNGIDFKFGHFYTLVGYEYVQMPESFFYSFSYTALYGEPGTHTGLLASYPFNDNWSVTAGAITGSSTGGWDSTWNKQWGNWSGIALITWTSDDKASTVNLSGTYGKTSETSNAAWAFYSAVIEHHITDSLHLIVQHDHGFANNTYNFNTLTPNSLDAQWYGINTHLHYDVNDEITVGIRGEWFRDRDGFRVLSPVRVFSSMYDVGGTPNAYAGDVASIKSASASYYEITAGLNWKPVSWLRIRPNVRYDWVDGNIKPFDGGNKQNQFLFSTDVTVQF